MDAERLRAFVLKLPHVVDTVQWGDNLVLWAGDKAVGGKMFALLNLGGDGKGVISYAAGPERYAERIEVEGIVPAPYFARIFWVAVERWDVWRTKEWEEELRTAYELTIANLPPKTRKVLTLPPDELQELIVKQRALLASRKAAQGEGVDPAPAQGRKRLKTDPR